MDETSMDGQWQPNEQDGNDGLVNSTSTLSEQATEPLGNEQQETDGADCLSVDHEMTAVLEAGVSCCLLFECKCLYLSMTSVLQVTSLSHQLEQTRAQLQSVEQQLLDEQQTRQSIERKLVEHEAAADERVRLLKIGD